MSKTSTGIFRSFCRKFYGKSLWPCARPSEFAPRQYGVDNPDVPYCCRRQNIDNKKTFVIIILVVDNEVAFRIQGKLDFLSTNFSTLSTAKNYK